MTPFDITSRLAKIVAFFRLGVNDFAGVRVEPTSRCVLSGFLLIFNDKRLLGYFFINVDGYNIRANIRRIDYNNSTVNCGEMSKHES